MRCSQRYKLTRGERTHFAGFASAIIVGSRNIIRLSASDGSAETPDTITSVEPDKTTDTLVARVFDADTEELVPNVDVRLKLDVIANSGGHIHHVGRPKGELSSSNGQVSEEDTVLTGNTGAGGLPFTFEAPAPAGDHTITGECIGVTCMPDGPDMIEVGIEGLVPMPFSASYELVGETDPHPNNHFLTPEAVDAIDLLAALYAAIFDEDPILRLNDASLIRGGVFDLRGNWMPKHHEHRRGTVIDVRYNPDFRPTTAIPTENEDDFVELATRRGMEAEVHDRGTKNQHFHVRIFRRAE